MLIRFTREARRSIENVLRESARTHGDAAAARYARLIEAAIYRLASRPAARGALQVIDRPDISVFSLRLVHRQSPASERVRKPRHLIVFRRLDDSTVEVLGMVHDRMNLVGAVQRLAGAAGRQGSPERRS